MVKAPKDKVGASPLKSLNSNMRVRILWTQKFFHMY